MVFPNHVQEESEESEPEDEDREARLRRLFPQIRPLAESIVVKTPQKLKHDEITICKKLVGKYGHGDAAIGKMFKDTKLNYLQWSKS